MKKNYQLTYSFWQALAVAIITLGLLGFGPQQAQAFHQVRITVTITNVDNMGFCFDIEGPFICSRPDYFSVVTFTSPSGGIQQCSSRQDFVLNRDHIEPNWTCSVRIDSQDLIVSIDIYDFDGGIAGVLGGDSQHVDVNPGPGFTYPIPVVLGTTTFDNATNMSAFISEVPFISRVRGTIVAVVEPAALFSISTSPSSFDPSLEEAVRVSGSATEANINPIMSVSGPGGTVTFNNPFIDLATNRFEFIWDGQLNGIPAPEGVYTINVTGQGGSPVASTNPPSVSTFVRVIRRPSNALTLLGLNPSTSWNPGSGALEVKFSMGSQGTAGLRIFEGAGCGETGNQMRREINQQSVDKGQSTLLWDGKDETGGRVLPGIYSVELSAFTSGGYPTTPSDICSAINLIQAPPLEFAITHSPLVPMVGNIIDFTAMAFDAAHVNRPTGGIEVWVATQEDFSTLSAPTSPVQICQRSHVCHQSMINLTSTTGRIAYKAVAYDIDGAGVETPWRIVDVVDQSAIGRPNPVAAGVASEEFGVIRQDKALDIVFFPGSNFDLSEAASGRREFLSDVGEHIMGLWGISRWRRSSTFLMNQQHVSFWVSLQNVPVRQSNPARPDARDNLCQFSVSPPTSWADVSAVVHRVVCRDNAPGKTYSAKDPNITWHEMHHAAFGLADEYGPDGGYFQIYPFPNLYFWPGDCNNDPNAPPGGCRPVRASGNLLPGQSTRWWRIDLDPDVMINNSNQQGAERRRSSWFFDQCKQGRC